MPRQQVVYLRCNRCGNQERNHAVVAEYVQRIGEEDGMDLRQFNVTAKCLGCDAVRFYRYYLSPEITYEGTNELEEWDCEIFPSYPDEIHQAIDTQLIPDRIAKIYGETVICVNAKANTLAGGGLRATVEAICLDQQTPGNKLYQKINELVTQGVLAPKQAEFLHEERYIGNEALHELNTPTIEDLKDGLAIVEGLLSTIYVLPKHAQRLKDKRSPSGNNS